MNKIFQKSRALQLLVALLCLNVLAGCEAEYSVIDQAIYFADAGATNSKKIPVDDQGGAAALAIRAVNAVEADTEVMLTVDAAALERYNTQNETDYKLLDAAQYTLPATKVMIKAGQVISSVIDLGIKPMTEEMSLSGNKYAIPLTLTSTDGVVLESRKSMMVLLDKVVVTSVPILKKANAASMGMKGERFDLLNWTVEFRINISYLGTTIGAGANQAVFAYNGGNGTYIRFGDAMINGNTLQIKTTGTQLNCNNVFLPNRWYHIAFTCNGSLLTTYVDGELDSTLDMPGSPTAFTGDVKLAGNISGTAMMSEVRFWNVTRSKNEIANNMFEINPSAEGLVGYWKLNEGEGTAFKDATTHGYDGTAVGSFEWMHGVRSDGK